VQKVREWPVKVIQGVQKAIQDQIIATGLKQGDGVPDAAAGSYPNRHAGAAVDPAHDRRLGRATGPSEGGLEPCEWFLH
jgi:hypothetical protein